jgi:hypothetical protein
MAFPVWVTASGSLGTLAENTTFRYALSATGTGITYSLVSGSLPAGLNLLSTGVITGAVVEVDETTASTFTVRAKNADNKITDRSFTITVTGPDIPTLNPTAGLLFNCTAGSEIDFQISGSDTDPNAQLTYTLISGELPTGLRLTSAGKIIGITGAPSIQTSDDYTEWEYTGPVELLGAYEKTFTVKLSDGVNAVTKTYKIRVEDKRGFRADSTLTTADTDVVITNSHPDLPPIFLTKPVIGTLRHANYWIYPIRVYDPNQDKRLFFQIVDSTAGGYDNDLGLYDSGAFGFDLGGNVTLSEITIDQYNGILKGTLPSITARTDEHDILVRVSFTADDGSYIYNQRTYNLKIKGEIEQEITWISNASLGSVIVGEPSQLQIRARLASGTEDIYYRISQGRLPPGLTLTSNGLITGVTSKRTTEIDTNTTTFDDNITTVDKTSSFTVVAQNANGTLQAEKEFFVDIIQRTQGLFYDFWVKGLLPVTERYTWESVVCDYNLFPINKVYRNDDPNFGINKEMKTLIAKGVKSVDPDDLVQAFNLNHARKTYYFGDIKYAESRNPETNDLEYEVIYVELIDPLENSNGSPALQQAVVRSYGGTEPITADIISITADSSYIKADYATVELVYPNSTENMRKRLDQFLDTIDTGFLPYWMRSLQESSADRLGYTRALVMAYVKPGEAKRILRKIQQAQVNFNQIHYEVDRYYVEPIYKYATVTHFDERITTWEDITIDSEVLDNKFFVFQRDTVT